MTAYPGDARPVQYGRVTRTATVPTAQPALPRMPSDTDPANLCPLSRDEITIHPQRIVDMNALDTDHKDGIDHRGVVSNMQVSA